MNIKKLYIKKLDNIVDKYNNAYYRTIKRTFINVKTFTNRITIKITNLKLLVLSKNIKIK